MRNHSQCRFYSVGLHIFIHTDKRWDTSTEFDQIYTVENYNLNVALEMLENIAVKRDQLTQLKAKADQVTTAPIVIAVAVCAIIEPTLRILLRGGGSSGR